MRLKCRVLAYVHQSAATTKQLAEALDVKPTVMSTTVAVMHRLGYIREARREGRAIVWAAAVDEIPRAKRQKRTQKQKPKVSRGGAGTRRMKEISAIVTRQELENRNARRDHQARNNDAIRDRLAADVEAFMSDGGEVELVEGYRPAPPAPRAFAIRRS